MSDDRNSTGVKLRVSRSRLVAITGVVLVCAVGSTLTLRTRQGVNYEVSSHPIPLYLKAIEFVARSVRYGQLADQVTGHAATGVDKVLAVFEWTRRNIRPTPDDWPVIDDHVLNIIIRGHGVADQLADVFTTLCAYAGVPAFFARMDPSGIVLSFVRVRGRWAVIDVAADAVFRNDTGGLATLEELRGRPELAPRHVADVIMGQVPCSRIVTDLDTPNVPVPSRAEMQMPVRRLRYEISSVLGVTERSS